MKERLQEILEYADWEGGLDEIILHMDGPNAVNGTTEELYKLAKNAVHHWNLFEEAFFAECKKHGAEL